MYPWLIEDPFRIGTYGIMAFVGFMVAYILFKRELDRVSHRLNDIPTHRIADVTLMLAVVFGIIGSKLAFMFMEAPEIRLRDLFMDSGLTWYGGWLVGSLAVIVWFIGQRLNILLMADLLAPMHAIGYAFGRIGCQLAGDGDYGLPCVPSNPDDFLCMTYPRGTVPSPCYAGGIEYQVCPGDAVDPFFFPVHPTPVYEAITGFILFGVLWSLRKKGWRDGTILALYCVGAGVLRFAVEFIRMPEMRPERFAGLRDAQIIALCQVIFGVAILTWPSVLKRLAAVRTSRRQNPE